MYPGAPPPGAGAWGYADPWAGAYAGAPPPGWPGGGYLPPGGPPQQPPAGWPPGAYGSAPPGTNGGYAPAAGERERPASGPQGEASYVLSVQGCKNDVVADIVNGMFSMTTASNHGRPVWKKNTQTSTGLDVHVYYWDDRDGDKFCGWYFGQKVGGDEVWAYHPTKGAASPPASGYQVPYDGPVDPGLTVSTRPGPDAATGHKRPHEQPAGYDPNKQPRQDWAGQMPPPGHYMQGGLPLMPPGMPVPGWEWHIMQQQQQMAHYQLMHQQQQQALAAQEQKKKEEQDRRRRIEDEKRKKEEENKRKLEELMRKRKEETASKSIMQAVQKIRVATPENFDALKKDLESIQEREMPHAGANATKLREEADKALAQAQKCVDMINQRRKLVEDKRREMEARQKAMEDRAAALVQELKDLVTAALGQSKRLAEVSKPLGGIPRKAPVVVPGGPSVVGPVVVSPAGAPGAPGINAAVAGTLSASMMPGMTPGAAAPPAAQEEKEKEEPPVDPSTLSDEELLAAAAAIERAGAEAEAMTKSCTTFVLQKGPEMKGLVPVARKTDATDMNQALAKLLAQIQDLAICSEAMLAKAKQAKLKVLKRSAAREKTLAAEATFRKYDRDGDGALSRIEVQAYSKGEFDGFRVSNKMMETIWKNLVEEGSKGIALKDFQQLRVHVGISREVARDEQRKLVSAEKLKVLERIRAGLHEKLRELAAVAEDANKAVTLLEKQVQPLVSRARRLTPRQMVQMADTSDGFIRDTAAVVNALRGRMADISEGVEERFKEDVRLFVKEQAKPLYANVGRMEARMSRARNLSHRFRETAGRRRAVEWERLRTAAWRLIRHNKRLRGLSDDEMFGTEVSIQEFLRFFDDADKQVRLADERAPSPPRSDPEPPPPQQPPAQEAPAAQLPGEAGAAPAEAAGAPDVLQLDPDAAKEEAERWLAGELSSEAAASKDGSPAGSRAAAPAEANGAARPPEAKAIEAPAPVAAAVPNGIDNLGLTDELRAWLGLPPPATAKAPPREVPPRVLQPVGPPGPEFERVELSQKEATKLFNALLGADSEEEEEEPLAVLSRDTLLARLSGT